MAVSSGSTRAVPIPPLYRTNVRDSNPEADFLQPDRSGGKRVWAETEAVTALAGKVRQTRAMVLSAEEARVLACLIEKEATVPDSYPLTLNALRLACNQAPTATRSWPTTIAPSRLSCSR